MPIRTSATKQSLSSDVEINSGAEREMADVKPEVDQNRFRELNLLIGRVSYIEMISHGLWRAFRMRIDLGVEFGDRWSVVQVVDDYGPEDLLDTKVVVLANAPEKEMHGHISEVLVLGAASETGGITLLSPTDAAVGSKVY